MCISQSKRKPNRAAFTLLELMLAISILAIVTTITFMCFATVTNAWKRGTALSDSLDHGDLIMDQLLMGLRSAYFPQGGAASGKYGFWMKNTGGEHSGCTISWVKVGSSLLGKQCPFSETPHRVEVTLEPDGAGENAFSVRAWRLEGQPEDFDPDRKAWTRLPGRVQGFDCKVSYRRVNDEVEWLDEWEDTNRVPTAMKLSVYLPPIEEGGQPIVLRRITEIPVGTLSWQ